MENLEPKTRLEYFLNKIAENKSSGSGSESGGDSGLVVELTADNLISFPTNTYVTFNGKRYQISNLLEGIVVSDKKPLFAIALRANNMYQVFAANICGYITLSPYGEPASEPRGDEFASYTIANEIQVWFIGENEPIIGFVPESPALIEIVGTDILTLH